MCGLDCSVLVVGGEEYVMCFIVVMNDDFNMLEVYLVLFDMVCEINWFKSEDMINVSVLGSLMCELVDVIGIFY